MQGIYTIANDSAYDQLMAFLNSVQMNIGKNLAVCIIPYNKNMGK